MHAQISDLTLEALSDTDLRARLAHTNWENAPVFVTDEQVFRLFRRAREACIEQRITLLSISLSRRLLTRAKAFIWRSGIFPGVIGNLEQAAEELSQYIWECLVTRPKDAVHAEKFFGQLFKCRALDFQRRLLSKKRMCQDSLDAMDSSSDDEDPDKTIREITALRQDSTPSDALAVKQEYALVAARLQAILNKEEYLTFVMLKVEEMQVKDIATALGVTTKSINNYKNAALKKIQKEFNL